MTAAVGLAVAAPAAAVHGTEVNCNNNPNALQPAITAASPGDTLRVRGTCTGNFTIDKDLTLIGIRHAVLDGTQTGTTVTVTSGARVRLTNLTITNGRAIDGGGILNQFSTVTLDHSVVRNNVATDEGGGIFNAGGTVTLDHSTVSNNTAGSLGGGIENFAGMVTLTHSTVCGNHATDGGGIESDTLGTLKLSDSTVEHNTATGQGGGIFNFGTVTLIRSTVEDNTAGDGPGSGGGIYNAGGTVTLIHSRVRHNHPDNCAPPGSVTGCPG